MCLILESIIYYQTKLKFITIYQSVSSSTYTTTNNSIYFLFLYFHFICMTLNCNHSFVVHFLLNFNFSFTDIVLWWILRSLLFMYDLYNNWCTSGVSSSVCFHLSRKILVCVLACLINDFYVKRLYYNCCTDMASPLCVSSFGIQECNSLKKPCNNGYITIFFLFGLL